MFTFLDSMKKNPKHSDKFCGFAMSVIENRSLWGSTGSSGVLICPPFTSKDVQDGKQPM